MGGEGLSTVKLSDVGLSRTLASSDYYRKVSSGLVPVKWMAPESILERLYTSASDVWSYGVLCWEVYTLGEAPYPGKSAEQVLMAVKLNGYRMERPALCPERLYVDAEFGLTALMLCRYEVVQRCWSLAARERPTFRQLRAMLEAAQDVGTRL